ncbi:N-acetylgalactosamine-6-sulfatase [Maribellus luteus]|uniref:N-acetylgalactosamine-6-sulfatase n=1 Tax=Maribellus luteus TaxID=2305463 RepID=A0A399T4X0_9BACT|nr:arylsulfatase [Maribellus luteus]RIJ50858.1 N-acetylgalactosamine-6-sulfatase [Maribellus luteus]
MKLFAKGSSVLAISCLVLLLSACSNQDKKVENKANKPNIIYILADDLGYGDVGCNGQKLIETPNIDKLAAEGMRFTQHYAGAPVCAPSRCVLLTGQHTGHSQIRGNDEWKERGDVWNYLAQLADSTLEGQRPLEEGTETLASLMKKAGYSTGMIGKWGLGAPNTTSTPTQKGFDFFVGYNCQRQAHTFYPVHLYKNDKRLYLGNDTVAPNTKLDPEADPYNLASYSKYTLQHYAPDVMFSEMMGFMDEHKDDPFFFYWATTIPHAPLQAPQRWIDYYVKKFGDEEPYLGDKGYFPQRYPHAAYAAMISYLDENIGKLVQKLKDMGVYDNTLIIFTSDNGPTYNGGTDSPWFDSGGPFKSEYGWGKGFVHEGGFRVPMIASWPDKIKPGKVSDHISAFWDVMPTFCDIAGIASPSNADGMSFLPTLLGAEQPEHPYLYWEYPEYGGQQAVRIGNWKGIRKDIIKTGNLKLELYDLSNDIQELNDVASEHPDIIKQMEDIMQKEHKMAKSGRFRMKALGDDVEVEE